MRIELNGAERDVPSSITLSELINHLALAPERLAIELNRRVVRRNDWQQAILKEGDRVEIVHFVGGGMEGDYHSD
ncbi:MAG: thiamine biosynthesis protein ThiS [Acidobacteria bacterium]|nr:MAG: thiamine biosynthesis protein ThiS [Acidobacteriota bacterium]